MKIRSEKSKSGGLIWVAGLLLVAGLLRAQAGPGILPEKGSTLQRVPPEKLPRYGTFWSSARNTAPWPMFPSFLREAAVEVYLLDPDRNVFVVNDVDFDYAALYKAREEQRQLRQTAWKLGLLSDAEYWAEEGGGPGPMADSYGPEEFWLEIRSVTNNYAYLTLHGTEFSDHDWYQLLSKTNLAQGGEWTLGELLQGYPGTNQTDFSPVNVAGDTNMFFRAQHEAGYIYISGSQDAYESNAVFAAGSGSFTVSSTFGHDVTAYYRVSGTASNGVDFASLSGVLTISSNTGFGTIEVQPISDGIAEGSETVAITLIQTNGYLIAPNAQLGTLAINDLSTEVQLQGDPTPLTLLEPNGPPGSPATGAEWVLYREDSRSLLPALTVPYAVTGSASNGADVVFLSGTVTFAVDDVFAYLSIIPLSDNLAEGVETVTVTLLPTNTFSIQPDWTSAAANIDDSSTFIAVVTRTNAIEPHPASGVPGRLGCFSISRYDLRGELPVLTVGYQLTGVASNGVDYTSLSGSVVLPAGETDTNIFIQPLFDGQFEGVETVVLALSTNIDDYKREPGSASATLTIADTTTTVGVSTGANAIEPDPANGIPSQTGFFSITRSDSRGYLPAVTVTYQMSGIASNNLDYTNLSGTMTIPLNQTNISVFVEPLSDNQFEGSETVKLTLTQTGDNYGINSNSSSATVTIADTTTVVAVSVGTNATEPNPASGIPGAAGFFSLTRSDPKGYLPALTVTYQLSGTASNNVDYTNLSGTITLLSNQTNASVFVQAMPDDLIEGDETVKLTLTQTGDAYLINSNSNSSTISIVDNLPTNIFQPVVTSLFSPVGIDYHQPSNSLIVSFAQPASFARIYTNAVSSNIVTVVTNWSGVSSIPIEVKLLTVKATANGFTNGDMYFGSATGIGWLSADGTRSNLNWCILTNAVETNALPVGGSLGMDETGVFNNELIVVTSPADRPLDKKGVWRVDASGHPTLLTNFVTTHLEGVISLTNDVTKWGPWAGKIITGDENEAKIYVISADGVRSIFATTNLFPGGIRTEDFDIIPPNQDLYACDATGSTIVKISRNYFTNYVGGLLITEAGEFGSELFGKLFTLHWDAATTNFVVRRIPFKYPNGTSGHFEHVTFAPIDLPALTP